MTTLRSLIDRTNIASHDRAQRSHIIGLRPRLGSVRRVTFHVRSTESYSSPNGHFVTILWPNIGDLRDHQFTKEGKGKTPLTERVRVYCTCKAFRFTGPSYHSTMEKFRLAGQPPENRPPLERDPENNRFVCKHIIRCGEDMEGLDFVALAQMFNIRGPIRTKRTRRTSLDHLFPDVKVQFLGINDALPFIRNAILENSLVAKGQTEQLIDQLDDNTWEIAFEELGLIDPENMYDG